MIGMLSNRPRRHLLHSVLSLLLVSLFIGFAVTSCGPSEEELRRRAEVESYGIPYMGPEPITSRWYFKPMVIIAFFGGAWLIRTIASSASSGTRPVQSTATRPLQPSSPPQQPPPVSSPAVPPQASAPTTPLAQPTPAPSPSIPTVAVWHYREGGREFGPFTQDALTQLAAGEVIEPGTEVRREGGAWVSYRDIFGG